MLKDVALITYMVFLALHCCELLDIIVATASGERGIRTHKLLSDKHCSGCNPFVFPLCILEVR